MISKEFTNNFLTKSTLKVFQDLNKFSFPFKADHLEIKIVLFHNTDPTRSYDMILKSDESVASFAIRNLDDFIHWLEDAGEMFEGNVIYKDIHVTLYCGNKCYGDVTLDNFYINNPLLGAAL